MKKRVLLIACTLALLLVAALWLRPRVFDEELAFAPKTVTVEITVCKDLRDQVLRTSESFFDEALFDEIRTCLESGDLWNYAIGLACIEKAVESGQVVPADYRNKTYLRSNLVVCLRNDVYRLHSIIMNNPTADFLNSTESIDGPDMSDHVYTVVCWLLREFTFERHATLNEYWKLVLDFENSDNKDLSTEQDLAAMSLGNRYGEMLLAIAIPSVRRFTEKIDKIGI